MWVSFSVLKLAFIEVLGCCWVKFMTLLKFWSHKYLCPYNNTVWFCPFYKSLRCSMENWNGWFKTVQWREMLPALTHAFHCNCLSLQAVKGLHNKKNVESLVTAPGIKSASEPWTKENPSETCSFCKQNDKSVSCQKYDWKELHFFIYGYF